MNVKEDMLKKKKEINEKTEIFIFVFLAFILLTTWAMTQPFNSGPDEQMRYYVADYIYNIMELFRGEMIRLSGIKCGEFPMHIIRLYLIWCLHYL